MKSNRENTQVLVRPGHDYRQPHPVFLSIVGELTVDDDQIVIPEERFEFWAKHLWSRYPRRECGGLYEQLAALAKQLAARRYVAALQIFALATLGLDVAESAGKGAGDSFLVESGKNVRTQAASMAASGMLPGFRPLPQEGTCSGVRTVRSEGQGGRRDCTTASGQRRERRAKPRPKRARAI